MASGDEVVVVDPSDGATNIAMLPVGKDEPTKAGPSTSEAPKRSFLSRLNPFGGRGGAEAKKKKKEEEDGDDPGDIPADDKGKMQWLRKQLRKWLPPPWNYLVAGSPGTALVAFGGWWLYNHYYGAAAVTDKTEKTE